MKRRKLLSVAKLGIAASGMVPISKSAIQSTSLVSSLQPASDQNKPMQLLTEFRIFAAYYQFFVYDMETDPLPESFFSDSDDYRSDIGSYRQGYITNGKTILFGTVAHLNAHWIEVYSSPQAPDFGQAERVIALPLKVASGRVGITDLLHLNEPIKEVSINSGVWTVYLLAFNLGSDQYWHRRVARTERNPERLSDEQLRANWEFERYRIVLVPDFQPPIGVLDGGATVGVL